METVVVVGGEGYLGREFKNYIRLSKTQCDINDICSIQEMVSYYNPSVIINCAGIVGSKKCEEDRESSYLTNLGGVANLVYICNKLKIKLIQISTVYIGSDNAYSHSKSMAESVIFRSAKDYLVVALPWMFSANDDSFITKSINGNVSIYDNEVGYLAYAPDVVEFIEKHINMVGHISIANGGALKRKNALLKLGNILNKKINFSTMERLIPMPVIKSAPLYFMRPWQEALEEYANGIRSVQSTV